MAKLSVSQILDSFSSSAEKTWRRRFSKLTCFSTLFLIFMGGLVTSTGSGLSVPDWPLSYGTLFPPMVGGIVYEHSHRMVASIVGLFMFILCIWLARNETRRWVKILGFVALGAVIAQGILGGITVLFFLPKPVSILHGILAQTFFVLTIVIAYSQSVERNIRQQFAHEATVSDVCKLSFTVSALVYVQLILGALMRHTGSGLAIPDFPTFAGEYLPSFDAATLNAINFWRFDHNLPSVTMAQVFIHFLHRLGALFIVLATGLLTFKSFKLSRERKSVLGSIFILNMIILVQLMLGAVTIWSEKAPYIASLHVVTGAAVLGMSVLLTLRSYPLKIGELKNLFSKV